jgi:activating signal cointegrator 1
VDEYFGTLLNFEQDDHVLFLNDFKQRIFSKEAFTFKNSSHFNLNNLIPEKSVPKTTNIPQKPMGFGGARRKDDKEKSPKLNDVADETRTGAKKKTKYINLYGQYGQEEVVLLKGRNHCDCQATKHKLVNNCLKCGRIVCEQEGSGSCLFCGNLVSQPNDGVVL